MSSSPTFFQTLTTSLNQAAKLTTQKAKETCEYLRAPPAQVVCSGCQRPVIVPPQLFNWSCAACTLVNGHANSQCSACGNSRPQQSDLAVECTVCHQQVPVPRSNMRKGMRDAKDTTKKLVSRTQVAAKEKYEYLKAEPDQFNCEHCNTKLFNPNVHHGDGESDPEQKQAAVLSHIGCPTCKKVTAVPRSNFKNSLVNGSAVVSRTATRAYCSISGKQCVDCPVCKNPVDFVVPAPAPSAPSTPAPSAPSTSAPSAPSTSAPVSAPQMASVASSPSPNIRASPVSARVDLFCKKCSTTFPTTAMVQ